jgi:hypothetical protein
MKLRALILALALLGSVVAGDAQTDPRFGVMTHFAQGWGTDLIPLISGAGISHVRDELYWAEVEPQPGTYVFPDRYTRYMAS